MSQRQVFGTDFSSRLGLGVVFGFAVALGIAAAFQGGYLSGSILIFVGLGAWLYYTSLKVTVSDERVEAHRYGIVIFSAPRKSVRANVGRGGELGTHTALLLDAPGQKQIQLLRTLFGRSTLTDLARLLGVQEEISGGVF